MKTLVRTALSLIVAAGVTAPARAQEATLPVPAATPSNTTTAVIIITNEIPSSAITIPAPAATVTTNAATPKGGVNGTSLFGAFSGQPAGKFSVSGRTLRLPAPETTWRGERDWRRNLDFGMNQSRGNTRTLRYALGLDAVKDDDENVFRVKAKGTYGESDGTKDTENGEAGGRYERLLSHQLYALGNLDWFSDTIADLRYRVTAIASPGLRLVRSDTTLVNLEAGAGYIRERKSSEQDGFAAGRCAVTAERIVNAHVLLWGTGEYLPKLADTSVFYVNAEAGAAAYITRDLSLNVCYQERYDSSPVAGKRKADTVFSTAASLSF